MLLFKLLILAHLIADFPLQSAAVYRAKRRSLPGLSIHILICLLTYIAVCYPLAGVGAFWVFAAAISAAHLLIDEFKLKALDRVAGPENLWAFLLDQALHVGTVATVFLTDLPGAPALDGSALAGLDRSGCITVAIFLLAGTYGGTYLLNSAKKTFFGMPAGEAYHNGFPKYYGILERTVIFALVLTGGWWLVLLPLVVVVRLPLANHFEKKFDPRRFLVSKIDAIGSLVIASAAALCALLLGV